MKIRLFILLVAVTLLACSERRESVSFPLAQTNSQVNNKQLSPPQKSNTAVVISPHANLRQSDNVSAAVLQTVPLDSLVEVIKQQGGWFLVKTETAQGWMHGNTIKLQSFEIKQPGETKSQPKPAPETVDLRIKGNKNSMIYHLPGCASYGRIAERNITWFKTKEEAESAGFRMARNC